LGLTALRLLSPLTVTVVHGHSMEPSLRPGAMSLLDRAYYRFHPVSRGDVVVLRREGQTLIKRVYALPGERLTLLRYNDNNGNEVLTPLQAERLRRMQAAGYLGGGQVVSVTVPENAYFVLGDNRPASSDSREFGPVPINAILGRALL